MSDMKSRAMAYHALILVRGTSILPGSGGSNWGGFRSVLGGLSNGGHHESLHELALFSQALLQRVAFNFNKYEY